MKQVVLGVLTLFAFFFPLLNAGFSWQGIVCVLCVPFVCGIALWRKKKLFTRKQLLFSGWCLCFLGVLAVSCVRASAPLYALPLSLLQAGVVVAVWGAFLYLPETYLRRGLMWIVMILGVLFAVLALLSTIKVLPPVASEYSFFAKTYGHNTVVYWLCWSLPFSLGLWWQNRRQKVLFAAFMLQLGAGLTAGSSIFILSVLVCSVVFILHLFSLHRQRTLLCVLGLGGILGILVCWPFLGRDPRVEYWKLYTDLAQKAPVFGYGLGNAYQEVLVLNQSYQFSSAYAHNQWLQWWVELGIPGVLLLGVYILGGAFFGAKHLLSDKKYTEKLWWWLALFCSLCMNLFHYSWSYPAIWGLVLVSAYVLWPPASFFGSMKLSRRNTRRLSYVLFKLMDDLIISRGIVVLYFIFSCCFFGVAGVVVGQKLGLLNPLHFPVSRMLIEQYLTRSAAQLRLQESKKFLRVDGGAFRTFQWIWKSSMPTTLENQETLIRMLDQVRVVPDEDKDWLRGQLIHYLRSCLLGTVSCSEQYRALRFMQFKDGAQAYAQGDSLTVLQRTVEYLTTKPTLPFSEQQDVLYWQTLFKLQSTTDVRTKFREALTAFQNNQWDVSRPGAQEVKETLSQLVQIQQKLELGDTRSVKEMGSTVTSRLADISPYDAQTLLQLRAYAHFFVATAELKEGQLVASRTRALQAIADFPWYTDFFSALIPFWMQLNSLDQQRIGQLCRNNLLEACPLNTLFSQQQ